MSQPTGTITGAIIEGSNQQNNTIGVRNTRGEYFLHFGIIGVNPLGGFRTFKENNNNPSSGNNNSNNLPLSLPLLGFERGLERGFNQPPRGNLEGLDSNVAALVNALTRVNLGINHVERKLNYVKLIEFGKTEAEDLNK